VDAHPFSTVRAYLNFSRLERWGATAASAFSSLALLLLFPLLFLFVDLLTLQGRVPSFAELSVAKRDAFRTEWNSTLSKDAQFEEWLKRFPSAATETAEWEHRWRVACYLRLKNSVSEEAAESYLPAEDMTKAMIPNRQLGVLSLIARERTVWTNIASFFASWNSWTWKPNSEGNGNPGYLLGLFLLSFTLVLIRGLLLNGAAYLSAIATIEAASRIRRTIYTHGYRLSALATRAEAQDEAAELLTHRVEVIQEGLHADMNGAVRSPILIGGLLIILFFVHFWLTVSLLAFGTMVWLIAGQAAAWYRRDARKAGRRVEARLSMIRESLSLVQLVKAYLMERFSQTRFERHLTDLSRSSWRRRRGDTFSRPTLLAIASLAGVAMLYIAGRVVLDGEMTVAGLILKGTAIGTLIFALNRWFLARSRISRATEAAAEVSEFLNRRGDSGQTIDAEFLQPMSRKLDFLDVSLREIGTGRMILDGVSFSLPAGSSLAVVYSNLEEARAIAHLITRFQEATGGEVRIDAKNVRWVTTESIRAQVSLVLEQSLIFSDTIINNIGCGDGSYTAPQIIEAAKLAHVHQFVQRLPFGYETPIGDGGQSLTIGQKFRIALARAIIRDPSLLIIEEPSEPMDADSIALIDDSIGRIQQGRTVLFLARRPSTLRHADRVLLLMNGKVAGVGKHEELLNSNELYRLMFFRQNMVVGQV